MKGILVIGSNFGQRENNIHKAIDFIKSFCKILTNSGIYESPDNYGSGNPYLNSVLEIESSLPESLLINEIKKFELNQGRTDFLRERGEVPIDIDIVVWNDIIRRPEDFNAKYFIKGFSRIRTETNRVSAI